jgi:hypothetical protein
MATFPLAVRNAQLDARNARVLAEFSREAAPAALARGATAGGDWRRLRGIPAIGRGVAGAIPGTSPERAAA